VPDGPLQAETRDLQAAGRQPPGERVQGLLHVPGGQLPELDLTKPLSQQLDSIPVELPGPGQTGRSAR